MTDIRRTTPIFAALVLLLAACGGGGGGAGNGGTTSAAPTDVGATSGPTQAATSQAPASEPAPTEATPATEPPSGGGGTASDVCGLVTPDELATILGVPSVTVTVYKGPPDTCDIQADGAPLAASVLTTGGVSFVFDAIASGSGVVDVPGLGDRAIYSPETLLLLVQKGDSMISIAVFEAAGSEAERLELMKQIGTIAAGRM